MQNVERIYKQIPENVQCGLKVVEYRKFTHTDFLFAKDVLTIVYPDIMEAASNMINGICKKN